jgi:hypothetical protein
LSLRSYLQNHPRPLVWAWKLTEKTLLVLRRGFDRLGLERSSQLVRWFEEPAKKLLFDCRMCGQCVLHYTGMTCPMTCPKQLRNGPCGGVGLDGRCEVDADRQCVWVEAIARSRATPWADEIHRLNPTLDWRLKGLASWVTFSLGHDPGVAEGESASATWTTKP